MRMQNGAGSAHIGIQQKQFFAAFKTQKIMTSMHLHLALNFYFSHMIHK